MNQSVRPVVLVRLASVDRRKERSFESLRSSYVEKHELLTFFPAVCPFDRQSVHPWPNARAHGNEAWMLSHRRARSGAANGSWL